MKGKEIMNKTCLFLSLSICALASMMLFNSCNNELSDNTPFEQSSFIKNADLWRTPSMTDNGGFYFETDVETRGSFNIELLKESIDSNKVGNYISPRPAVKAYEWGYSVLNLKTGTQDGSGRVINNIYLDSSPRTREEALNTIKTFIINQYVNGADHPWGSMNGHHCWHHYAGEWGFDVLGSEIGENIHGYQFHIAMNRGAARQYQKPWFVDFSMWFGPGILDYSSTPIWKGYSGVNNGHSLSLMERSFVMSYMSGANAINAEAGAAISFYSEIDPDTNCYKLSPYGEICRDFYEFTNNNPDVGITYTPVAIVLNYYHGLDRQPSGNKAFGKFVYGPGDLMTHDLVDAIWKDTWAVESNGNEIGALSNNTYGDSFDFLLQNASQDVLNSYPALVLSGDMYLSDEEIARYKNYVQQGGVLVLNTAYLDQFPEYAGELKNDRYEVSDGEGKVIVYGPDYDVSVLKVILKELVDKLMPIKLSTDIQSIVNIKDGYIYVTLINNSGVTKTFYDSVQIDKSAAKKVTVSYTGNHKVSQIRDIYNGNKSLSVRKNSCSLELQPGAIAVLEIKIG